jgi:site-specific recombinase XerD/ribosomal protein L40E
MKKRIENEEDITKSNKGKIIEYTELMEAKGLKPSAITKDLYSLYFVAKNIGKNFKDATRQDTIKLCSLISSKEWTEKTKATHRVGLKKFFKWIYGMEGKNEYPEVVSWMNTTIKKSRTKLPEDLITEEEVEKMLQAADSTRDKALTLLLYETGARIGEILNVRIKHIRFQDGPASYMMLNGKTGMRRVTIVASTPLLASYVDVHPFKNDPEQFLFLTKSNHMNGRRGYTQLTYAGAAKIVKTLAQKAGVKKRIHPHLFRHSSATRAAKFLTEAQMKTFYGWTSGSNMPAIYVHLSGRDTEDAIKRMHGIQTEEPQQVKVTITTCRTCNQKNSPGSKFCNRCGTVLDLQTAIKLEQKQKGANKLLEMAIEEDPALLQNPQRLAKFIQQEVKKQLAHRSAK